MTETKRIELKDGGWVVMRTTSKVGDVRYQREKKHERGFDDPILEGLDMLQRMIVEWSFGEITADGLDDLDEEDAVTLSNAMRGLDDGIPNSRSSSAGTRRKRKSATSTNGPSNG